MIRREVNETYRCRSWRGLWRVLVNENGDLATARLDAKGKVVVLKGDGWDKDLTAEVDDKGKSLKWSNGTVWKRR